MMKNGDHFTGEIKELNRGVLSFKSVYMSSSVQLDWEKVASIQSEDFYIVMLADGRRLLGKLEWKLEEAGCTSELKIEQGEHELATSASDVVQVRPMETNFWRQLTGTVGLGFNYYNADSNFQFNTSATATYRNEKNEYTVSTSDVFSRSDVAESVRRGNVSFDYRHMLSKKKNWFVGAQSDWLKSSQQQLDYRVTGGAAAGHYFINTNRTTLSGLVGVVVTREKYSEDPDQEGVDPSQLKRNNVEGLFGADLVLFRFGVLTLNGSGYVYPSLSNLGRVRTVTDVSLSWEFHRNLVWGLTVYHNYDSRPPEGLPAQDVGVTNSLSWKF